MGEDTLRLAGILILGRLALLAEISSALGEDAWTPAADEGVLPAARDSDSLRNSRVSEVGKVDADAAEGESSFIIVTHPS